MALEDLQYLRHVQERVARGRDKIRDIAAVNGLTALPSAANFVAVDCGVDGNFARAVLRGLVDRGIFVRMPQVAPQDRCIRISVGNDADLGLLQQVLPRVIESVK